MKLQDLAAAAHVAAQKFSPGALRSRRLGKVGPNNLVPMLKQQAHQMLPDKAGGSCYQNPHQS